MKKVLRLSKIECIVPQCGRVAVDRHAICSKHLTIEVLLTVVVGLTIVGGVLLLAHKILP